MKPRLMDDNANRLTSIVHDKGGTIASASYTLDNVGNRTGRVDQQGTHSYAYDNLYRLTSVTYPGPATTSYAFDAFGNRTSKTDASGTTAYAYDDADRITAVTPLSSAPVVSYTWDNNGNLTNRGSDSFSWDYEDRMTSATLNSVTSTFAYRGDGLRDSRTTGGNTATFTWDIAGGLPVVLDDGSQYVYGAGLTAMKQSGSWVGILLLADGLGSTMAIVDSSGAIQKGYTYDVYGKPTATGSLANEYDFAGQQTDATGLQYLRARYMDPQTGTFLSRDPLSAAPGWSGQPFGYVGANPAGFSDPTGLCGGFLQLPTWLCGDVRVHGDTTVADVYDAVDSAIASAQDVIDPWLNSYIDANVTLPIPGAPGAVLSLGCQVEIMDPLDPHCYAATGVGTPGASVTVAPGQTITDGAFCELSAGAFGAAGQVGVGNVLGEKGKSSVPFVQVGIGTPQPGGSYTCGIISPGLPDLFP